MSLLESTTVNGAPAPASTMAVAPPAEAIAPDGAPQAARPKKRDGFLDTMRTVALGRVILWHAFGIPWISWVVATMPMMFFIAGSLLASTLDRKPLGVMYRARLKRLLVPYWFFSAVVLAFLSLVHLASPGPDTALRVDQLLPWVVPFTDPTGPAWEGGWASSPMWYLRAYLWLLLISPVLRAGVRRFGTLALLPSVLGAAAVEFWLHNPDVIGPNPGTSSWMVGEMFLYSFFLMLGFCHRDGAFNRLTPFALIEWLLIGVAGCALWWSQFPAPTGVINHSFIGLLAIGIAWIAFFLLLRPVLSRATENTVTGPVVYLFNRRAMSIYLWHSPAIAAGYWILDGIAPEAASAAVLVPTAILLVVAIAATGWIEDISGGRSPDLWPSQTNSVRWQSPFVSQESRFRVRMSGHWPGLAIGAAAALIVAGALVSPSTTQVVADDTSSNEDLPPAPSGRPGVAAFDGSDGDGSSADADAEGDLPPAPSGRPGVASFGESDSESESSAGATTTDSDSDADADATAVVATPVDAAAGSATAGSDAGALESVVAGWLDEFDVAGARVAISMPDGSLLTVSSGEHKGEPVAADDVIALTSATKSVTGAIVLDLVDQGLVDLDGRVPALDAVPEMQHDVTVRQLLNHTAGIAPYQETAGFDSNTEMTAVDAVRLSAAEPLQWTPGTERGYSNSGYLMLGLLAEQLTGQSLSDLVDDYVGRAGASGLRMDDTIYSGWVGSSAGGVVGTVSDLATWGAALYRDGQVLSASSVEAMTDVDNDFGVGLGAFPVCPCGTDDAGARTYTSIGHNGGEVSVQYSPADDVVIAVSLTESLWTPFLSEQDVYVLLEQLRAAM